MSSVTIDEMVWYDEELVNFFPFLIFCTSCYVCVRIESSRGG